MKVKTILSLALALGMVTTVFASMAMAGESLTILGSETLTPMHDDASVEAWIPGRPLEIVTDRLGVNGQSGGPGTYMYNPGNYATNWADGETDRNIISWTLGDRGYSCSMDIALISGAGFQVKAPSTMAEIVMPDGAWDGDSVPLTWADPGDANIDGYLVYRSIDNSTWTLLAASGATGFQAGFLLD